jgi:hypothetical protein
MCSKTERAQHAAWKAEQRIATDITSLPAGWFVLTSPELDEQMERRPEHVAIGPSGVFFIYLEHHAGAKVWVNEHKLTVDGRATDDLRAMRFEARRASSRITEVCGFDVTVQSVLVLIGIATMQTLRHSAEVHVRMEHDLRDWLCRQPNRLDADETSAVHRHVRGERNAADRSAAGAA